MKSENKTEEQIIAEYGVTPASGRMYEVERPFQLNICDGPPVVVEKGQKVFLDVRTGNEMFFSNRVTPCEIGEIFEVVVPFQIVRNGEYVYLEREDVIRLSREEAIALLREHKVKEKRGGSNETQGT